MAKLLGEPTFVLPDGVPAAWAERLEKLLAPLDKADGGKGRSGLAKDILGFVLQGEPMAVLSEVAQRQEVGERLALTGFRYGRDEQGVSDVYEHFDSLPPSIALRWTRILDATVSSHKGNCRMQFPRGVVWPEVLLMNSAGCSLSGWSSQRPKARHVSVGLVEAMLVEDGLEAHSLLAASFGTPVSSGYGAEQRLLLVTDLAGYPQALDRHIEAVRALMLPPAVPQRLHVLNMLEKAEAGTLDALAPQLCELGTSGSKQVRAVAEPLLRRCSDVVLEPLRSLAIDGKPEQRANALRLIAMFAATRSLDQWARFAHETAAADKAPSVQALVGEWATAQTDAAVSAPRFEYTLPVIDWSATANTPASTALNAFWRDVNESIAQTNARAREWHAQQQAKGNK
jgi:hypothetical protein